MDHEYNSDEALIGEASEDAKIRATEARQSWGGMHNAHQAFAVLHEEFDELKTHVWSKEKNRSLSAMRDEAIDVAATAIRVRGRSL